MQAFPTTQYANGISPTGHAEGMTLRDYFAAKAMQGLLSSPRAPLGGKEDVTDLLIAKLAYVTADAMMESRNVAQ
jgi:hypothetical protein